ncbi:MAG TPA: ATP-binding protein [Burkholderiales bacterium]|nr:ATP-binding protein [Burkholderiales bacterium]
MGLQESDDWAAHRAYVHGTLRAASWVWDIETDRVEWFGDACGLLGVGPGAFSGRFAEYLARLHPEDAASAKRTFVECLKGARGSYRAEERALHPDGSVRWLEVSGRTEYAPDGRALRMAGVIRDITGQREAEQRIRELETFSVAVSHDLLAPARNLSAFAGLLLGESPHSLGEERRDIVEHMRRCAQRMEAMVQGLLDLSRVGRSALHVQPLDMALLAGEAAEELRLAGGFGGEVCVQALQRCRGDARLVRQVLQNLLGNAMKFSRGAACPRVEVSSRPADGGQVEYCVRDNGCGFDMDHVGRLFQPFHRLHSQAQFEGTGVGLSTVKRIVERHGGAVRATGERERGAAFYFTLPAV